MISFIKYCEFPGFFRGTFFVLLDFISWRYTNNLLLKTHKDTTANWEYNIPKISPPNQT